VSSTLTRRNATFSERDQDRHVRKHITDDAERAAIFQCLACRSATLLRRRNPGNGSAFHYMT
jgi:hypothetical protein